MFKSNTIENNLPIIVKVYDFEIPSTAADNIWPDADQDRNNKVIMYRQVRDAYRQQRPIIFYDYGNDIIWYGDSLSETTIDEEYQVSLFQTEGTDIIKHCLISFNYNAETNKVVVNCNGAGEEQYLVVDNVKTLFGNQSIIGSGNIDLFNHFITLTLSDNSKLYLNFYSSNKLVCDSIQDFTTMTKAKANTKIAVGNTYINYTGSIWQTANSVNVNAVSDVVTTI